ncbi:MAG: ParD-like family protein [Oceanospirillaceae bacterium]|nr:ParD-like family protein [Oceanospirillaceae bacterium]MBT4442104.1 ParD-like family protein [Oceanospirillaceae bacterium]MBT6076996.1 ParD-like family protein [Oceanospirillaceae bacterium]
MSISIHITDDLYQQAKVQSKAELRTIPSQIEFWARVGRAALDNPDLPIEFIRDTLVALDEENSAFEFVIN